MLKRAKKLDHMYDFIQGVSTYGDDNPDIQLVIWGSTKGACLDAMEELKKENIKVKLIQMRYLCPFPVKQFEEIFSKEIPSLMLEHNRTGQLKGIIREETGIVIDHFYGKFDARPMYPEHIVEQVKKVLGNGN